MAYMKEYLIFKKKRMLSSQKEKKHPEELEIKHRFPYLILNQQW